MCCFSRRLAAYYFMTPFVTLNAYSVFTMCFYERNVLNYFFLRNNKAKIRPTARIDTYTPILISRICRLHSPRGVCPSVLTGPVPSVAVSLSVLREFFIIIRKTPSVLLDFFCFIFVDSFRLFHIY